MTGRKSDIKQSKTCTDCGQIKPLSDFHAASDGKYGVRANCKECKRAKRSAHRINNHEQVLVAEASYRETNRQTINDNKNKRYAMHPEHHRNVARNNYNPDNQRKRAKKYRIENPQKIIEGNLRYRTQNKEKVSADAKAWRAENPEKLANYANERRAKQEANGVFMISKKELKKLYSAKNCFYCKEVSDEIQMDHVIPIKKGGRHSIGNLVPACRSCNQSKRDKTITQWNKWKTATLDKS
jgi:5-methylcytosine-specific restriction endonuclease McrA